MRYSLVLGLILIVSNCVQTQWQKSSGLDAILINCFASRGDILLSGTQDIGVYRSTNNGESWVSINGSGLTDLGINSLSITDESIVAATNSGIFYSYDNGTNWAAANSGDFAATKTLISDGNLSYAGTAFGIFTSFDDGGSWSPCGWGSSDHDVRALDLSGGSIFAGTATGSIRLSTNAGVTWSWLGGFEPSIIHSLLAWNTDSIFVGTEGGGMYLLRNNGVSWDIIEKGSAGAYVYSMIKSGSDIFAAVDPGGILHSTDMGDSWTEVNDGLPDYYVYSLHANDLYAFSGPEFDGIWRRPLNEMIIPAQSINLTAPNGGEYWAIGSIKIITWDETGIDSVKLEYSTDGGTSWIFIDEEKANVGTYAWTIPNSVSTIAKIRISDLSNAGVEDVSESVFTIYYIGITVDGPYTNTNAEKFYYRDNPLYSQNTVVVEIKVWKNGLSPQLNNIKVRAILDGHLMDLHLNTPQIIMDSNIDGLIDNIPSVEYHDSVFILATSQIYYSNQEYLPLEVIVDSVSGYSVNHINCLDSVSLYFAKHPVDQRPFTLVRDAYNFTNPAALTLGELVVLFRNLNILAPVTIALQQYFNMNGRCTGMSYSAGEYFLHPERKVYPDYDVHSWPEDPYVLQEISKYHLAALLALNTISSKESYEKVLDQMKQNKPSILFLETAKNERHAVLVTKLMVLGGMKMGFLDIYDSRQFPPNDATAIFHLWGDYAYEDPYLDFISAYNSKSIISLDEIVRQISDFYAKVAFDLISSSHKIFSIGCSANIMVTNSQGNKYGYDTNGMFVNEIPNSEAVRIPTGDIANDSLTLLYVPSSEKYFVQIFGNASGTMRFETFTSLTDSTLYSLFTDSISITDYSICTFDEEESDKILNIDNDGDGTIDSIIQMSPYFNLPSHSQTFNSGWNLISVPLEVTDLSKIFLFPQARSQAFAYEGSYLGYDTLTTGQGYWLKFDQQLDNTIYGYPLLNDTFNLHERWNIVGSLSMPIPVNSISSDPPGIVTSNFFAYNGTGYIPVDTVNPGFGYWVKASQPGKLILSSHSTANAASRIKINPTAELPPSPPGENEILSDLPKEYLLQQAYPNPFNPSTTFRYNLPYDSRVTFRVYNILGQVTATLADGIEPAGLKSVTWNAANAPSGVYLYRLDAMSNTEPPTLYTQVKKVLLIR